MFRISRIVALTIFLFDSEARIVVAPINATVCEGSTISLECSSDTEFKLRWFRVYVNDTKERIYSGRKLYNETLFGINTTGKGQFDLVIKSASLELAGTYECVEQETHDQSAAEVIILEYCNQSDANPGVSMSEINNSLFYLGIIAVLVLIIGIFCAYTLYLKRKRCMMEELMRNLTTPSYAAPATAGVEPQLVAEYADLSQLPETYAEIQLVTNIRAVTSNERDTFEEARSPPGVEVAPGTGGMRTEARIIPTYVNYKSHNP